MRKLTFVFLFFIIVFFSLNFNLNAFDESKVIICIDPGNGGMDGGTVTSDALEKDINLSMSMSLKKELESLGFEVLLTRENDSALCAEKFSKKEDLHNRIEIINNSNAILFVSIHMNSFPNPKYRGAQVFYGKKNANNEYLAYIIQSYLCAYTDTKREYKLLSDILLLKKTNIPGCLIECGFLSNEEELALLTSKIYQNKLAKVISMALSDYLKVI